MVNEDKNNELGVLKQISNNKQIPFTNSVEAVRIALRMSRSDLAAKIGTTNEFCCMVEHSKFYPNLAMRLKIAKALNTDTSALFFPSQHYSSDAAFTAASPTEKINEEPVGEQSSADLTSPPKKSLPTFKVGLGGDKLKEDENENN